MAGSAPSSIAILGGAGRAGRPLVQAIRQAGYHARLLLRTPEAYGPPAPDLTIIRGDARDPAALRELLTGSAALLSTLGNPRGEDAPIQATVTGLLLPLLTELGIRRYVAVTSLYDTGQPQPDAATRQAVEYMEQYFPRFVADRRREYELLQASTLDWSYVRLPRLVETPATGVVVVSGECLPGSQLTTADLARFLVEQMTRDAYVRQAPFVANG